MQLFPHQEAEFLDPGVSDHCAGLLTIKKDFNFGPKPFKFHGFFMSHNDFPQLLHKAWSTKFQGDPTRTFCLKLKEVKTTLKLLNKKEFWDISIKTIHAQEAPYSAQRQLQ